MRLRSSILLAFATLLTSASLRAQPNRHGVPLITNYPYYQTGGSEQNWCVTKDLRGVLYVGNQDKGVLEYDGVEWRTIPVPNNVPVYSLVTGDDGFVYVGAANEFGRLEPDGSGKLHYRSFCDSSISEQIPVFDIWRTFFDNNSVYFCAMQGIFIYTLNNGQVRILEPPEDGYFSYVVNHTLYHVNFAEGLMQVEDDQFTLVKGGDFFKRLSITGIVPYDDKRLLISTYVNGLYLFNTETGVADKSFMEPELMETLTSAVIPSLGLHNEKILVSTAYSGLYILDRNFEVLEIISENEGLIDETVSQAWSDRRMKRSAPIWIANWRGVSKVEANNPFRLFSEKSGFEGLIHDITWFDGQLYISTSQGLYYKSSTGTSTHFVPIPEIQEQIWDLQVMEPRPGKEILIASGTPKSFMIDKKLNVTSIREQVINAPDSPDDQEQYSGRSIYPDPKRRDVFYTGLNQLVGLQYHRGKWKEILRFRDLDWNIYDILLDRYGFFWISTRQNIILRIDLSVAQEPTLKILSAADGLPGDEGNRVYSDPEKRELLIGTKRGFYRYNYFYDTLRYDSLYNSALPPGKNNIHSLYQDRDGDYWFSFENQYTGWSEVVARRDSVRFDVIAEKPFQRLPNASVDVFFRDDGKGVWFSKADELYHFDKSFTRSDTLPFKALIRKVAVNNGDSVMFHGTAFKKRGDGGYMIDLLQASKPQPVIPYQFNNIEFRWAAPFFEQEERLQYSYKLEGFSDKWSGWQSNTFKEFTNLKYGKYTLRVKALNVYGDISEPASYSFIILRPWYASIPAIIAYILLSGLLVFFIIKLYTRRLKQENLRLEGIIDQRTAEIRKQKEELTDSIEYASRIQRALLPSDQLMEEYGIEHFILFRPRDIVSGDFYWMGSMNDKLLIVAADCTGHGVPGAFMSMLGMTFLDEIVIKSEITSTDKILETLREHVIRSLVQSGKKDQEAIKDGMDLAMVSVDTKTREIQFSGAYNPLYLVRKLNRSEKNKLNKGEELELPKGSIHDNEYLLLHIRGDQMPIGVSEKDMTFSATTFKDEGFNIYMFSDGFLDQFGGSRGKKFMSKNFKKLLLELQSIPLKAHGGVLEKVLLEWMGDISQIDDILVMGLRINSL
ncbi:MAG: triple tyrosine motif-containing protein [Bacteroidota bacterium]